MFFRLVLAVTLFSCSAMMAQAPADAKTAKIEELLKVAKLDQVSSQMMKLVGDQVKSGMMQQLAGVQLTPEQQKRFDDFNDKAMAIITGAMGWDKVKPGYVKIYSNAFTEQQIDDILTFYRSPAGQAMVEKTPELLQQGGELGRERLQSVMPELQQLLKDFAAQEAKQSQPKQ